MLSSTNEGVVLAYYEHVTEPEFQFVNAINVSSIVHSTSVCLCSACDMGAGGSFKTKFEKLKERNLEHESSTVS